MQLMLLSGNVHFNCFLIAWLAPRRRLAALSSLGTRQSGAREGAVDSGVPGEIMLAISVRWLKLLGGSFCLF